MFQYFNEIHKILKHVKREERENIEKAELLITQCILDKNYLYGFGASHAGILIEELFYRAGGLILFNPIFIKDLMLDTRPISLTSKLERLESYAKVVCEDIVFNEYDVLIIHSVSGRNPIAIEMALHAKKNKAKTICITNLKYSNFVDSKHSSELKLHEICDVVIDNHGCIGDASISLKNNQKVGPTSTVVGACILNQIIVNVVKNIENSNLTPPVFYSANIDGNDELNRDLYLEYYDCIKYEL